MIHGAGAMIKDCMRIWLEINLGLVIVPQVHVEKIGAQRLLHK